MNLLAVIKETQKIDVRIKIDNKKSMNPNGDHNDECQKNRYNYNIFNLSPAIWAYV